MRRARLLLQPILGLACIVSSAQTTPAAPPAPTQIRVSDSYTALAGPWRFTPGDSPITNDTPTWASPTFDDSSWPSIDLHPTNQTDPGYGLPEYLPGWSGKGFPNVSGFAWYRLRIHLADPSQPVALKTPDHVDDSFQVFANGKLIGAFGHFTATRVDSFRSRPLVLDLPPPDANGDILLAFRFYMEPLVLAAGTTPDSGGMHQTPLVGLHSAVDYIRAQEVRNRIFSVIGGTFAAIVLLFAAAAAFWIWLLDRPRTTYLWLTVALLFNSAKTFVLLSAYFTFALYQDMASFLMDTSATCALVCWIFFWRRWFQLDRDRRLEAVIATFAVIVIAAHLIDFNFSFIPAQDALRTLQFRALCNILLGLMLFISLFQGARKDRTGALVALPPIMFLAISIFSVELLSWFRVRTLFFPFGLGISVADVASMLLVLVAGVLVARRFIGSQISQRLARQSIDQDLEHACELQQRVLIPELITSSVFTVDTAYHPARLVGGDFFQVIPHDDGSLLIVVGDVSGKGIAAAMLVAVLVGATRTRADETFDPAAILHTLNARLLNRAGDHFATCIAAHLRPNGTLLIANAGHIPPYLDGIALDLPGSIPLGIIPGAEYDTHTFHLAPSANLIFFTDGVLEARNAAGALLGFDRLAELSPLAPEAIANAAITHGQDDDITIVRVSLQPA